MRKTCCIISQEFIPKRVLDEIEQELYQEIQLAVKDGFNTYISGFDTNINLLFSRIVLCFRESDPDLYLEAALACRGYLANGKEDFTALLSQRNGIAVYNQEHTPDCLVERNRVIIKQSRRIIAVCGDRQGGHAFEALRYAGELKREIRLIKI